MPCSRREPEARSRSWSERGRSISPRSVVKVLGCNAVPASRPGAWAGTAATIRGGCGKRRIASLILAKLTLHPSPGVEVVYLSGGEALGPHGGGRVASSSAAPAGSGREMLRGSRGSRGRYGTCGAAALIDLRETGASGGGVRAGKHLLHHGGPLSGPRSTAQRTRKFNCKSADCRCTCVLCCTSLPCHMTSEKLLILRVFGSMPRPL